MGNLSMAVLLSYGIAERRGRNFKLGTRDGAIPLSVGRAVTLWTPRSAIAPLTARIRPKTTK